MTKYTLETLDVYNLSETFSDAVWLEVEKWKYFEKDTVGKQLVRAVDSISANIAEGYGRYSFKEDARFLHIARGSATESKSWLSKCTRRRLIEQSTAEKLLGDLEAIMIKLNAYINFVERGRSKKNQVRQDQPIVITRSE
jgi:four helix bundle protein